MPISPAASAAIARLKSLPSDTIKGLPAAEWFAWCVIIFGSSAVGSAVEGDEAAFEIVFQRWKRLVRPFEKRAAASVA